MSDCVLDASAAVLALAGKTDQASGLRARLAEMRCHAPHLVDAEIGHVLRRHERAGLLSGPEALLALRAGRALVDHRHPAVGPVSELAWTLRHNLSFYDALYIALATLLDIPLVTADERLSRAADLPCTVEVV